MIRAVHITFLDGNYGNLNVVDFPDKNSMQPVATFRTMQGQQTPINLALCEYRDINNNITLYGIFPKFTLYYPERNGNDCYISTHGITLINSHFNLRIENTDHIVSLDVQGYGNVKLLEKSIVNIGSKSNLIIKTDKTQHTIINNTDKLNKISMFIMNLGYDINNIRSIKFDLYSKMRSFKKLYNEHDETQAVPNSNYINPLKSLFANSDSPGIAHTLINFIETNIFKFIGVAHSLKGSELELIPLEIIGQIGSYIEENHINFNY